MPSPRRMYQGKSIQPIHTGKSNSSPSRRRPPAAHDCGPYPVHYGAPSARCCFSCCGRCSVRPVSCIPMCSRRPEPSPGPERLREVDSATRAGRARPRHHGHGTGAQTARCCLPGESADAVEAGLAQCTARVAGQARTGGGRTGVGRGRARALAREPDLPLLDELFGALDALTRIKAQQLVAEPWQRRGCAVLLVTHTAVRRGVGRGEAQLRDAGARRHRSGGHHVGAGDRRHVRRSEAHSAPLRLQGLRRHPVQPRSARVLGNPRS